MGKLTVFFVGICSHVKDGLSGEVPHRVVLFNWNQDGVINDRPIKAHRAALRILPEDILGGGDEVDEPLTGVTITVKDTPHAPAYENDYHTCLPRLSSFVPPGPMELSDEVVRGKNANLIAAYFDAPGTFTAGRGEKGCAITVMTVQTPNAPVLQLESFDGAVRTIELNDEARIQVENIEPDQPGIENDWDFLVHFKIFTDIPSDAQVPRDVRGCKPVVGIPFPATVGPGCSNSAYP